jgi:hypothetical protein
LLAGGWHRRRCARLDLALVQRNSSGPESNLANELPAAGRADTVETYVRRCQQFWKLSAGTRTQLITLLGPGRRLLLTTWYASSAVRGR